MACPFDHIDHPFQTGPAIETDVADAADVTQVADCTREQRVASDCLNGKDQSLPLCMACAASEAFAERESLRHHRRRAHESNG